MCHIASVSEGARSTEHIHSDQRPVPGKAGVMDCLWERAADRFPWSLSCLALSVQPNKGEIESVCSLLPWHVFPSVSNPLFSSSQVMFQVGWQSAATGSPGNLSLLSKNMFWPSVPHLECYLGLKPFFPAALITQCSWQVLFSHPATAKTYFAQTNQIKGHT